MMVLMALKMFYISNNLRNAGELFQMPLSLDLFTTKCG
jgi:hypothetical protein